jgi:poly(3-hydroxyalkanoate) synthetase
MQIDGDIIDLRKITVPLLTIVAKHERVLFNEAGITLLMLMYIIQ